MKRCAVFILLIAAPLFCQTNRGELRIKVTDPSGAGVKAIAQLVSKANQYRNTFSTTDQGELDVPRLPYGIYQLAVGHAGFAPQSQTVEIRSSLPTECTIQLKLAELNQSVTVNAADTLIDPDQAGSVTEIGSEFIRDRLGSVPGRDVQDLVNSQPGWLYEGNAVLHPRGSEYQTQFVVDGIPLTDDRSPGFGPEIEADDIQSMSIYTAGFPAEFGRKMGGVVEINTEQDVDPGFHGRVSLYGGSFDTAGAFAKVDYSRGKNILEASGDGSRTGHYLNPVVPENYSNTGTVGDFSVDYRRELTANNKFNFSVRHELSRYDIPNELVQQAAGQRQNADNLETMGIASYEHTFSANSIGDLHGMVRDNSSDFYSNPNSIPVYVNQHNSFREGYFRGGITYDRGRQEWKAGVESDNLFLHENTCYTTTQDALGNAVQPARPALAPALDAAPFAQDAKRLPMKPIRRSYSRTNDRIWSRLHLCRT